ncbi:MAG: holo-ACP synthase [Oscillospiraceae bacterium]
MVIGIGVDTTLIERIEKSSQKEHFMQRFFSDRERAMFARKGNIAQSIAGNYAAKEALGKALGTGLSGFVWNEASILRAEIGAPYFIYEGHLQELMQKNHWKASVSITHEGEYATAFVLIEENK